MLTIQAKQQNNVSFKAGLTPNIIKKCNLTYVPGIESAFKKNYGVNARFENNHAIAYCCAAVADIFEILTKKFNLPFGAVPPNIRIFRNDNLIDQRNAGTLGFCLFESSSVLKGEPVFETRSLFLNSNFQTLNIINSNAENNYNNNRWSSTNHFLHTFIHEWVHNVHTDVLYRMFGYDGTCPMARQRYNSLNGYYYDPNPYVSGIGLLTKMRNTNYIPEAKKVIQKEISEYAAGRRNTITNEEIGGNPFEVVAETITKKIVKTLNPNTLMPERNPFASNGNEDNFFQDIFNKAWYGIIGG